MTIYRIISGTSLAIQSLWSLMRWSQDQFPVSVLLGHSAHFALTLSLSLSIYPVCLQLSYPNKGKRSKIVNDLSQHTCDTSRTHQRGLSHTCPLPIPPTQLSFWFKWRAEGDNACIPVSLIRERAQEDGRKAAAG